MALVRIHSVNYNGCYKKNATNIQIRHQIIDPRLAQHKVDAKCTIINVREQFQETQPALNIIVRKLVALVVLILS